MQDRTSNIGIVIQLCKDAESLEPLVKDFYQLLLGEFSSQLEKHYMVGEFSEQKWKSVYIMVSMLSPPSRAALAQYPEYDDYCSVFRMRFLHGWKDEVLSRCVGSVFASTETKQTKLHGHCNGSVVFLILGNRPLKRAWETWPIQKSRDI